MVHLIYVGANNMLLAKLANHYCSLITKSNIFKTAL